MLISDTPSCMRWWLTSLNLGGINTEQPGSISPSCTTPRQRTIYLWLHKNGFLLDDDSLKGYIYVHLKEFEIFYPQLLCGQKPESKRNWTQLGKFCRSHQIGKTFAKNIGKKLVKHMSYKTTSGPQTDIYQLFEILHDKIGVVWTCFFNLAA